MGIKLVGIKAQKYHVLTGAHLDSELKYEESNHSSYYEAYGLSIEEQPAPEAPTNVLINMTFPCCPGCEVLSKPVTELVPIEEDHPIALPHNN